MKKLNEIVANELLHELKEQWQFDYSSDCVLIIFYAKYDTATHQIGRFYTLDCIGEYLLEQFTVKGFKFDIQDSPRFGNKSITIEIVLNM